MSNLILNWWAASKGSQTHSQGGSVAATFSPADMTTTGAPPVTPLGPTVSTAPASLTSSVTHHVLSAWQTHQRPRSSKEAQQFGQKKKNKGPCRLFKTSHTTRTTTEKITITWNPRHRAAATKKQHNVLPTDVESVIRNHCPLIWESWRAVPQEVKEAVLHELLQHHYELSNLDANQM